MMAGMSPPPPSGGEDTGRVPGGAPPPDPQGAGAQASPAGAKEKKDVDALRVMEAQLQEMSESYPTAVKSLRTASEAIMSARRQIISNPGQAEPPVPNTYS